MLYRMSLVLCALFFGLSGCRQDYSLSPPADSEKITVTVKLPEGLKNKTMWVMYRSATCKHIGTGASGQRTERDGYHSVYKELERQGQSDLYQVELPKDGGGACRWHLANVTFGVEYADLTRFGETVMWGGGGGVGVEVAIRAFAHAPRNMDVQRQGWQLAQRRARRLLGKASRAQIERLWRCVVGHFRPKR